MPNQIYTDAAPPPIIERLKLINMYCTCGDQEAATKTITATAEASGLGNADYTKAVAFGVGAALPDARVAILNLISFWTATIDSDDGTHDLRCRVYIDAQDADHLIIDATCTATGAQIALQNLNSSTLPIIFNLIKNLASHTFYFYLWTPGSHAPVISQIDFGAYVGSNSTTTVGVACLSFTSPVVCELQTRVLASNGTGTGTYYAFIGESGYYDAGFAFTDAGAVVFTATTGSSAPGSWTWQLLPAGMAFTYYAKNSTAASFALIQDLQLYIKRWN